MSHVDAFNVAAIILGALVVMVALVDLIWTTLASSSGAGPLTARLASQLWKTVIAYHRRRPSQWLLSLTGVVIVLVMLGGWIGLTLGGWWLIALGSETPFVDRSTGAVAGVLDRLYVVGYSLVTLGNGDFAPVGAGWQMLTVAMATTGLILVTLSISYLIPIVSAARDQRALASMIHSLGNTPQEIVTRSWTGRDFGILAAHLANLAPLLHAAAQSYLTYPALHYFQPARPQSSIGLAVTTLGLTLDLLDHGVRDDARPSEAVTAPCRAGIQLILGTAHGAHIRALDEPVPLADLDPLNEVGIPVVPADQYRLEAGESSKDRRLLAGLLHASGRDSREIL